MLSIGFGLILYTILKWLLYLFVVIVLVVPFFMNLLDGKGFGYNFKKVWGGLVWLLRMGFAKRT